MSNSEQILIWTAVITSGVGIIALIITVIQLVIQTRMTRTSWRLQAQWRLTDRFDSPELREIRRKLGSELSQGIVTDDISEMLDFFEEVGAYLEKDYIEERMTWHNFYYWAACYWTASEEYVKTFRGLHNDPTYWKETEYLVNRLRKLDVKETKGKTSTFPTKNELKIFAEGESTLV